MALSAVGIVVGKLADITLKKALEMYDVGDEVGRLKKELNMISAFLEDADAKRNKSKLVEEWVSELRDLAYRIEDALDKFLVEIEEKQSPSSSMKGKILRIVKKPMKVGDISYEIKRVTEDLKMLYDRGNQMGINKDIKEEIRQISTRLKPSKPSQINNSGVVGLESDKEKIISHLTDTRISERTVLSIVGPGGLGKTTLAQKVYKSIQLMKGKFACCTWLSISQKFDENNLLRQILYSVEPEKKNQEPPVIDDDLSEEVQRALSSKRYLIILDDVWTVRLWEQLEMSLPDQKNASRVLITSRNQKVAVSADRKTEPYKLRFLEDHDSLTLLLRTALKEPTLHPDQCDHDYKSVADRLIKKCGGLPLALVVLGGILSTRTDSAAWEKVEETLDWHEDQAEQCSQILALSYEDLPLKYKPCFLYFASFPEDYEICGHHITKMWVAEGFIQEDGKGTMEDRAKEYLTELVQRCLVQGQEGFTSSGWRMRYKMHDLLLDLAIHEAKKDKFLTVFLETEDQSKVRAKSKQVVRRAALQSCTFQKDVPLSSETRSLICFGDQTLNFQGFKLLRVVNFDGNAGNENIIEKAQWLKFLIHLKFLGFRDCGKNSFTLGSVSFNNFKNFETLYLSNGHKSGIRNEPNDSLWKVHTLRNVISNNALIGPSQWDDLEVIQTLKWVRFKKVPLIGDNQKINLRKIGFHIDNPERWKESNVWQAFGGLLRSAIFLTSLSIRLEHQHTLRFGENGTHDLPCHKTIKKLDLSGPWAIPLKLEILPINLVKLILGESNLKDDPMPTLEKLKCLRVLELNCRSYTGTKLICSENEFPCLRKLELKMLQGLSEWEIKERAMRILDHLKIEGCPKLQILPDLRNLTTLKQLIISDPAANLYARLENEDLCKIEHIPSRTISGPKHF